MIRLSRSLPGTLHTRACLALFVCALTMILGAVPSNVSAADRTLEFPPDKASGTLWIYEPPQPRSEGSDFLLFSQNRKFHAIAKGNIKVPEDAFVGIDIRASDQVDAVVSQLSSTSIQRIDLTNVVITTDVLRQLEQIESLRYLMLWNCRFDSPLETDELSGAPALQNLYIIRKDSNETTQHRELIRWAAKCPRLQFVLDTGQSLTTEDVQLFQNHYAPKWLTVDAGIDVNGMLDALANVPNLEEFNLLRFNGELPDAWHTSLTKMRRLTALFWSGGTLDEQMVNAIQSLGTVRELHVQGDTEIKDSFIASLHRLRGLERLQFRVSLSAKQTALLEKAIQQMPDLCYLPRLQNPSSDLLKHLATRTDLRRLQLSQVESAADQAVIVEIIASNRDLEWLTLPEMPWTGELAQAIGNCTQLRWLDLNVDSFDGSEATGWGQLRQLTSLRLNILGESQDLGAIATLPTLKMLTISVPTIDRSIWKFIVDCDSLENLTIEGGICDDRMADWIARSSNLRIFSVRNGGRLTDRFLSQISSLDRIESLTLSGTFSTDALAALQDCPSLRVLQVHTEDPDAIDQQRLASSLEHLQRFSVSKQFSLNGDLTLGADGIYREIRNGRASLDALEGRPIDEVFGGKVPDEVLQKLRGKVVLIKFWGTWCGPCLVLEPDFKRLHSQYSDQGLEVLGIHSQNGHELAGAYLDEHPVPWVNVEDVDGELAKQFEVPSYPSLYLVDRDGIIRVAQPDRTRLDEAILMLMEDE